VHRIAINDINAVRAPLRFICVEAVNAAFATPDDMPIEAIFAFDAAKDKVAVLRCEYRIGIVAVF
jgi:hypothetical protein